MADAITRAEFAEEKAKLVQKIEFDLYMKKLDRIEAILKDTRSIHFQLKEDLRDWQASEKTEDELLRVALKPLFHEDADGTMLITHLKKFPEMRDRTERLWFVFKVGAGLVTLLGTAIGLVAALL